MIRGLTGLRPAVMALGLAAFAATGAQAAPILNYQTAAAVDLSGVTNANVISVTPAVKAGVDLGSGTVNASLGTFVVAAPPTGSSTTYTNTPFTFTFLPTDLDGNSLTDQSLTFTGKLNGVVDSAYRSTVSATFDEPVQTLRVGDQLLTFSFPTGAKLLVPSMSNGGVTTAEVQITSQYSPVPEPSTVAVFLASIGGVGLRRYVSSRRSKANA